MVESQRSSNLKKAVLGLAIGTAVGTSTVNFVAAWEGVKHEPYLDVVGVQTVCYGHTGPDIESRLYSQAECEAMLMGDLQAHVRVIMRAIKVPLSQGETIAYSSLAFNIGVNAFANSRLVILLNAGDRSGACKQLLRWRMAGGRIVRGLVNRRKAEYALCIGPQYAAAK